MLKKAVELDRLALDLRGVDRGLRIVEREGFGRRGALTCSLDRGAEGVGGEGFGESRQGRMDDGLLHVDDDTS